MRVAAIGIAVLAVIAGLVWIVARRLGQARKEIEAMKIDTEYL